jgi:UDP-glucuronate decarboxylase
VWQEHHIVEEDLQRTCASTGIPWEALDGRTVFVTGAAGLIGRALTQTLLWHSLTSNSGTRVLALVRDARRAESAFGAALAVGAPLSFVVGDVLDLPPLPEPVDFVVHGASITSSRDFVERPVDTLRTAVLGTQAVLDLARASSVRSLAHLSSMEVYGAPQAAAPITEQEFDGFDPMLVRSSYPEAKRMAEAQVAAYASQFAVPGKVVRLTQTFGPGVRPLDGRVFAEFARCAVEGRDIVLHTTGETERSYLYTADAVTAILTVLLRGDDGQAYNAANDATYCSVRQMAELVATTFGDGSCGVRVEPQDPGLFGYAPTLRMRLDTRRLQALGWAPTTGLTSMYERMLATWSG